MKRKTLDQIDANLEQIIQKLVEAGKDPSDPNGVGMLNPLEFDSLALAQETLGLLRRERRPRGTP